MYNDSTCSVEASSITFPTGSCDPMSYDDDDTMFEGTAKGAAAPAEVDPAADDDAYYYYYDDDVTISYSTYGACKASELPNSDPAAARMVNWLLSVVAAGLAMYFVAV